MRDPSQLGEWFLGCIHILNLKGSLKAKMTSPRWYFSPVAPLVLMHTRKASHVTTQVHWACMSRCKQKALEWSWLCVVRVTPEYKIAMVAKSVKIIPEEPRQHRLPGLETVSFTSGSHGHEQRSSSQQKQVFQKVCRSNCSLMGKYARS